MDLPEWNTVPLRNFACLFNLEGARLTSQAGKRTYPNGMPARRMNPRQRGAAALPIANGLTQMECDHSKLVLPASLSLTLLSQRAIVDVV